MKIKMKLVMMILLILVSFPLWASQDQERIYLRQMLNQLQAIKPLIIAASHAQPKTNRIQFHYTQYRNPNGQLQNGLLEDIQELEKGIQAHLQGSTSQPHHFSAIKGDYSQYHRGGN